MTRSAFDQRKFDYLETFSSGEGKRVLDDLRLSYGDRISFDESHPDGQVTAFREGQRSVYLGILYLMDEAAQKRKRPTKADETVAGPEVVEGADQNE